MSEIRLVAMSAWRVQTIAETMGDDEGLLGAIWDAGITEEEGEALLTEARRAKYGVLPQAADKLRAAFQEPVPEDSPDA